MQQFRKVAIVHDFLPLIGGAERVLEQIVKCFPGADIYTLFDFLTDEEKKIFGNSRIITSYLNNLPGVRKYYRKLLPLCPQAIEDFDLSAYDLIISSSYLAAKGVITRPSQIHISYVHSPARYAWDLTHQYLEQGNMQKGSKGFLAKRFLSKFRIWDYRTANGVDMFVANSKYISRRIYKTYRRESEVIYPPVNVADFQFSDQKEDFYLTASRLVSYKRFDLIAAAFSEMPDKQLVIIGDGPEMAKIKQVAQNKPNITMMGYQETAVLKDYMQRAKAFVFAAEEDFGIIPVEAQACGTPVIAFGAGGTLETVINAENSAEGTGILFPEQSKEGLIAAVKHFENLSNVIKPENCRRNAEKFSEEVFQQKLMAVIQQSVQEHEMRQAA